jgi:peptide-methionine (R)-S-oxide reductase
MKDDKKWKEKLNAEEFAVLREKGTEPPFTSCHLSEKRSGTYECRACEQELFKSKKKFESGSGWPSFWEPASETCLNKTEDVSHGMMRVEVTCSRCGSHLGHVFPDGPPPTGERYCINGLALHFTAEP